MPLHIVAGALFYLYIYLEMSKIVKTAVYLGRSAMEVFNGELGIVVSYWETVPFTDQTVYDDLIERFPDLFEEVTSTWGSSWGWSSTTAKWTKVPRWFGLWWITWWWQLRVWDMSWALLHWGIYGIRYAKYNPYNGKIYCLTNTSWELKIVEKDWSSSDIVAYSWPTSPWVIENICFGPEHIFCYVPSASGNKILVLNTADNSWAPSINKNAWCIIYDAISDTHYWVDNGSVFSVDPTTGETTTLWTLSWGNIWVTRWWVVADKFLYVGSSSSLYKFSLASNSQAWFVSPSIWTIYDIAFSKSKQQVYARGTSAFQRFKCDNALTSNWYVNAWGSYENPFWAVHLEDEDILLYWKWGYGWIFNIVSESAWIIDNINFGFNESVV